MMVSITLPDLEGISPEEALSEHDRILAETAPISECLAALSLIWEAAEKTRHHQEAEMRARGIEEAAPGAIWEERPHVGWLKDSEVTHNGEIWVSRVPYNIWEPGTDGGHAWVRKPPQPEEPGGVAPWAASVSYEVGDTVTHAGKTWRCTLAHVSHTGWAPSIHTHSVWKEVT